MSILDNVKKVQEIVNKSAEKADRYPSEIKIVAVSKTKTIQDIREAFDAGLRCFGENRIQEAEEKIPNLNDLDIEWHLIGHLQTNKVKKALPLFQMMHSVDTIKIARELEKVAEKQDRALDVLIQVNISGEYSKFGTDLDQLEELVDTVREAEHITCHGLMTIPPFLDDPEKIRPYFKTLWELGEKYRKELVETGTKLELSMGMTNDFPVAIEEGATMVRIGTAIFGERDNF